MKKGLLSFKNFYVWCVELKKLTLMGLDQMVKITDRLFSSVLSQMPLKQLVLTSDGPIEKQVC